MADFTIAVPIRSIPLPDSAVRAKFTDTMDIDQERHRLYFGDNWSGGVDVFDITTKKAKFLQTIKLRGNIYGIAVGANVRKLFVGLTASLVGIVDIDPSSPKFHTVLARVNTGGQGAADLLDYDPVHKKVYVGNHDDGFVTSIDAVQHEVLKRIGGLGGAVEQPRFNPGDGMVYVSGRTDNVLYQIDPETDELVNTFPIGDPCYPNGIAINPSTNQALLACNNEQQPRTVIWDFNQQALASVSEDCGSGDGALYVRKLDRFLFAADGFTGGPVMGIFGGNPVRLLANIPTDVGASWVAYDETNDMVYAPAIQDGKPALISFPMPTV
jgi:hypothetical protein